MNKKITLLILLVFSFGFAQTKSVGTTNPPKSLKTNGVVYHFTDSGNWNVPTNWSPASVPTSADDVVIDNGALLLLSDVDVEVASFTNNGTVQVSSGKSLKVTGLFTNNTSFKLVSSLSFSPSLIAGSASGNITYSRYLTGGANKWHLISAPLGAHNLSSFVASYGSSMTQSGVKYSLAPYDNTGVIDVSTWKHYTSNGSNPAPATPFVPGKGYEILMTASQTVDFTGTIETGVSSIDITVGASAWNLIGNPYPSSIFANINANANNFLSVNSAALDPSFVAMYVWNPTNGSYDLVNQASAARSLAPGQGFFVKTKAGGATAGFTTAMRTHQNANAFQKTNTTGIPSIVLSADNNNGIINTTEIKYMGGTTLGLDPGYDAGRFGGVGSGGFGLFSHLVEDNNVDFALQVVPDNSYNTTVIPIGLEANAGTQVTFKADATDLPLGKKVFIEDKLLNTVTELNNSDKTYTITLSSDSNGIGRFFIHTQDNASTLGVDDLIKTKFTLVASPNTNRIKVFGLIEQVSSLDLYDSLGRQVFTAQLNTGTVNDIQVPSMATGVYFVKIKSAKGNFNQKIIWY